MSSPAMLHILRTCKTLRSSTTRRFAPARGARSRGRSGASATCHTHTAHRLSTTAGSGVAFVWGAGQNPRQTHRTDGRGRGRVGGACGARGGAEEARRRAPEPVGERTGSVVFGPGKRRRPFQRLLKVLRDTQIDRSRSRLARRLFSKLLRRLDDGCLRDCSWTGY